MKPRSLAGVAAAVEGDLVGENVTVRSVATDSRLVEPGALFVALDGPRRDGYAFVAAAFERGAVAALVRRGSRVDGPAVEVASPGDALLALAGDERARMDAVVVGITGANGKTSTKDMTAGVTARRLRTHASPRSFNNEIGTPMTLLGAPPDVQVVVAELGARREGDVAFLCAVARPDVVVVTNVGVAHMEVFGSWEAIVRASAEPVDALGEGGTAVLNADDPVVAALAGRTHADVVTFGRSGGADVRAVDVVVGADGRATFALVAEGRREPVRLAVAGEHMVGNALAAAAVGIRLGVPPDEAAAALSLATIAPWRMETFDADGVRVLNDAYNANPESMAAALRTAMIMAGDGRVIAVLGQMAELGPIGAEEHERLGELVARLGVARLITVGPEAKTIAVAAVREGVEPENVAGYDDADAALADVRAHARTGDVVLVKASRVAGLEQLAEALR